MAWVIQTRHGIICPQWASLHFRKRRALGQSNKISSASVNESKRAGVAFVYTDSVVGPGGGGSKATEYQNLTLAVKALTSNLTYGSISQEWQYRLLNEKTNESIPGEALV